MLGESSFPDNLRGERVLIRRDREFTAVRDESGAEAQQVDGFEGVVTQVSPPWIYVEVADPEGTFRGIWVNLQLQREVAVLQ